MSNQDKDIVITPNKGSSTDDPKIVFSGADGSTSAQNITLKVYPTNNGTVTLEGSAGQLFSIANSLTGTIFSVNDVSGIPSVEILDTGTVRIAPYGGSVGIGTNSPLDKLEVVNGTFSTRRYGLDGGYMTKRANGTESAPTQTLSGERIGYLIGSSYFTGGTSGWSNIVGISYYAAENQTDTARGGYMTFETNPVGGVGRAERMRLDAAGRLGINCTPGSYKLDILESGSQTNVVRFRTTTADTALGYTYGIHLQNTNATNGNYFSIVNLDSNGNGNAWIDFFNDTHGSSSTTQGSIKFATRNGASYVWNMILDKDGRLGIGTAPSTYRLEVLGTGYASSDFRAPIFYDSANTGYYCDPASTSNLNGLTVAATITGSVSGTSNNITAYTINQNLGTGNQVTFDSVITSNNGNGTNFRLGDDAWIGDVNVGNTTRLMGAQNNAAGYIIFGNGDNTALGRSGTGALTYGGNTVWHAGNDGTGSGLDADLWDGYQFSSYLNQAVLTSSTPTFAGVTSTGKIALPASNDGRLGLWFWGTSDSNWALYMGQPTVGVNPAGTTMTAGHFSNTHTVRLRSGSGLSMERYSDNVVTFDTDSSGNLWALGAISCNGNISAANLSGTNTGDQTNISGNAATATSVYGFTNNPYTSYGANSCTSSQNGYYGILFGTSTTQSQIMFDGSGNGGFYRQGNGAWPFYYHVTNGSVGIMSSATSASYALYVTGAIYSTSSITAYSDRRAKTNIVTVDNALDKVLSLRGVYYNKIDESDLTNESQRGKRQLGVIAQEVIEVVPEVVTYDEQNDKYGVAYGNLTSLLIEAIKEQQKQIDELKAYIQTQH